MTTRISLNGREKRTLGLQCGAGVLVLSALGALGLGDDRGGGWLMAAWFFGCGLFAAAWALDRYFGSTTLAADGLHCVSLLRRRRIAWADVQGLEVVCRQNRGSATWFLRAQRTSGRPVRLPGVIRPTGNWSAEAFDARVETVRDGWQRATGRADLPALLTE